MPARLRGSSSLGLLLVLAAMQTATQGADPVTEWRAVRESAIKGWSVLRETAVRGGLRGRYQYRRAATLNGKAQKPLVFDFEFGTNRKGMFVERSSPDGNKVRASNPDYAFDAIRSTSKSTPESGDLRRGELGTKMLVQMSSLWQPLLYGGFKFAATDVVDLVNSDGFSLLSFEKDDGRRTAAISFNYRPSQSKTAPPVTVDGGIVEFAVDKSWAIARFDCAVSWGRYEGKLRYRPFEGSFIPEFLESRMSSSKNDRVVLETYELKEVKKLSSDADLPVRLADYGLIEPHAKLAPANKANRGWMMVALNVTFLLLLLSVVFLARCRRNATGKHADVVRESFPRDVP